MNEKKVYRVIIIGGGPAGLAAAIALGSEMERGSVLVFDSKMQIGGQASQSSLIENYPGFVNGVTGGDLTGYFMEQASRFGVEFLAPVTISKVERDAEGLFVLDEDGVRYDALTVIIAGGLSYNRLKAVDVAKYLGRGIYYGAPSGPLPGKNVFVIGGANSAGQAAASFASQSGAQVRVLVRKDSIADSMSLYLIQKLDELPNVEVCYRTEVTRAIGNGKLEQLELSITAENGRVSQKIVDADVMSVFIGASPKTEWLRSCGLMCDDRGYVLTDEAAKRSWSLDREPLHFETCMPGVFAIGDIRAGSTKRIVTAAGSGGEAAASVHQYLALLEIGQN